MLVNLCEKSYPNIYTLMPYDLFNLQIEIEEEKKNEFLAMFYEARVPNASDFFPICYRLFSLSFCIYTFFFARSLALFRFANVLIAFFVF